MQHLTKEKVFLAFVVAILIFYVCMFLSPTNTVTNVARAYTYGVGVYWDQTLEEPVESIPWGSLTPGSVKSEPVYIQNKEVEPMFLMKSTGNWSSDIALQYMTLSWDYSGRRMNHLDVLKITLTLSVSSDIHTISDFSFDILVSATDRLPGDVNDDCMVTGLDVLLVQSLANFMKTVPPADRYADVNGDKIVNGQDVLMITSSEYFMKGCPP